MVKAAAIETSGLTKRYRRRGPVALDRVDLRVVEGEVLGFLGPNGAGKTTTIRLLLDLIRPTEGSVRLFGVEPRSGGPQLRRRLGYLPGELPFTGRQSSRELITFLGNLRGGVPAAAVDELAERFSLDLSKPIRSLSKGNKQKVAIVQAFMHSPELLVLDEPSSGLDPLLQREFLELVRERRDAGATVFMSSHILSEVESVADRIAVLREGRLVAVEDVAEARARAPRRIEVVFAEPVSKEQFAGIAGLSSIEVHGTVLRGVLLGEADALVKALAAYRVVSVVAEPPNLEDFFLGMYAEGGETNAA
jgi:ABC-2 type transport system ATP-binding protein